MKIGNREFDTEHQTYVMGILNVTPDSFSDGGHHNSVDAALFHAEKMVKEGADILDVGGESTRPGYTVVSCQEEIERVVPVIEKIAGRLDVPISVDTYKSKVGKAAVSAGACMINDIWGMKKDPAMASVAAQTGVVCCLMHNREKAEYGDFRRELITDLEECVRLAQEAGISREKILLDPGVGFGKTYEMNLQVLAHLEEICGMGFPVLLGASRKSVIGLTLDLPAEERLEGTLATTVLGVQKGCAFVRVHDVKENKRAIQMIRAIMEW